MVEAADIFNASDYRRTVGGIAKSLGEPRASIVPLSGVSGELIVTVAWDISWYQYRVTPGLGAARPAGRARARAGGARRRLQALERAHRAGRPARPGDRPALAASASTASLLQSER